MRTINTVSLSRLSSTIPARSDLSFQAGAVRKSADGTQRCASSTLNLHKQEAVTAVTRQDGFSRSAPLRRRTGASNVILAIGKLGNPRHLTIPGAERSTSSTA